MEYIKWFSKTLNKDMELKIYGSGGDSVLVFPCASGRFFDFEDSGGVRSLQHFVEEKKLMLFTVDSYDATSWNNYSISAAERAINHGRYENYIMGEVLSYIKQRNPKGKIYTTGASMGGYHAANFYLKFPEIFSGTVALSGLYSAHNLVGDYMDDNVYYNAPISYLPNLEEKKYLQAYAKGKIVICTGQGAWEEKMLEDSLALKTIFNQKKIGAWVDIWGTDVNHDWPWWHKQWPYFFSEILKE
ncbi:MAG: hypothetical protein A2451_11830 [Bdellovibrionales bacterium RIFOXYC2_FULL_39_8]|nr:MAG: hypothetical protein A2451_11830 [Bdellovibrionales bacterium RIFOXYC2_FULL_39_8]